jgi:hypothetical protein
MTHRCPVTGCGVRVRRNHLMCWTHWFQVPNPLRLLVSHTWNHGLGVRTEQHADARSRAIDFVNQRRERRLETRAVGVRVARREARKLK